MTPRAGAACVPNPFTLTTITTKKRIVILPYCHSDSTILCLPQIDYHLSNTRPLNSIDHKGSSTFIIYLQFAYSQHLGEWIFSPIPLDQRNLLLKHLEKCMTEGQKGIMVITPCFSAQPGPIQPYPIPFLDHVRELS
jgi:hypothetical protein